jgi:hypothetical protein
MTRKELKMAAQQVIERWTDESKPKLPGEPKFKVKKNQPMRPEFPIRVKCLGFKDTVFEYLIYAKEALDFFDHLDEMNAANLDGDFD